MEKGGRKRKKGIKNPIKFLTRKRNVFGTHRTPSSLRVSFPIPIPAIKITCPDIP
jgi:hypothetical protein